MSDVIKFPLDRLEKNLARHFNEAFHRMQDLGMTPEEQWEMFEKSLRQIGAVEIDGVWQMPPSASTVGAPR